MKAVIVREFGKSQVQLLGWGHTESAARIAAYAHLHHGHNPFDTESRSGDLVTVAAALVELHCGATWQDAFEGGELIGSHATDGHGALMAALGRLYVKDGVLDYERS